MPAAVEWKLETPAKKFGVGVLIPFFRYACPAPISYQTPKENLVTFFVLFAVSIHRGNLLVAFLL